MEKKMVFPKWVLCLSVVVVLLASPALGIDCGDALSALGPCESFLLGVGAPKPTAQCCSSAKALDKAVSTQAARRSVCQCFKQIAPSVGVDFGRVKQLPISCKISLKFLITPNMDCNKI